MVAPASVIPMQREPFAGWWRIDRASGDALGLGANGWGSVDAEEGLQNARTARTAPRWVASMRKFATAFSVGFGGYYGYCVAPLVLKVGGDYLEFGHSMGIWEGAIKPSIDHCVGDSIVIGGITAWLAVVGVAGEGHTPAGQSEPFESPNNPTAPPAGGSGANGAGNGSGGKGGRPSSGNEPGGSPQNEANPPNPKPPGDDPCQGGEGVSPNANSVNNESPGSAPEEPTPGVPEVPTAEDVEAARKALLAADQDYNSAFQVSSEAVGEYVRYTLRIQNRVGPAPNANGDYWPPGPPVAKKWPNYPGPQDYDPNVAQALLDQENSTGAQSSAAMGRYYDAKGRFNALYDKYQETHNGAPPPRPDVSGSSNSDCGPTFVQPVKTLPLGPGNTRPLGPGGPPSPIGPPIGPPPGTSPPEPSGVAPVGPGQTQPLSPGSQSPGVWPPPGSPMGPPPGTNPPGLGYTQPIGPPPAPAPGPGTTLPLGSPPGSPSPGISPMAKTIGGLTSALNTLGGTK